MIIVPDSPTPATSDEVLQVHVVKVFDGDGFLANIWKPFGKACGPRIPFRFAFIDAPEIEQPFGQESREFLLRLIMGKSLRLDPVGKTSTGGIDDDEFAPDCCPSDALVTSAEAFFKCNF